MAKVFISYAKADYIGSDGNIIPESPVAKIVEAFKDAGVPFWMDREGLGPGETFAERISRSILDCEVLLFISSATANASEWTLREISTAISNGKRIIPVRIDGSPYDRAVSFYLSSLQYIDWYDLGEKEALRRILGNILHPGFDSTSGIEVGKLPRLTSITLYAALVVLTALYAVLTYLFLWAKTLQSSEVIGGLIGLTQEFTLLLSIYYVIRLLRRRHSTFILPLLLVGMCICAGGLTLRIDLVYCAAALFTGWTGVFFACLVRSPRRKSFFAQMSREQVMMKVNDPENLLIIYLIIKTIVVVVGHYFESFMNLAEFLLILRR